MNTSDYEVKVVTPNMDMSTVSYECRLLWEALDLLYNSTQIIDSIKNGIIYAPELYGDTVFDKLSQVLWHTTAVCKLLNITLEDLMKHSIRKYNL